MKFIKKKRKNNKGLIAALAMVGISVGVGAGVAIAKKVKSLGEDGVLQNFDEYIEGIESIGENNIHNREEDNRYKETLMFRRDRVNKKIPKGIKGEKYY
ncbi:hypothetical protein [Clostridium frigidicarnis]|uniref:Uncharacterized protein n=1 Tax=Clostridium frigidicarnis TaxID=84698 RepID=A0A1I0ZCF9_9CLOT|nr:hypothetical protein [Clostridium frigidicarnis]SFB22098.1 hypothetical protein SAMN04488528_101862 [Clostridium frigidicarnis]